MVIFYSIVKFICFPGSLVKGFLEHLFCRILGIPVEFSDYLERNELAGHCEHMLAEKHSFAICFWPHIIMLILGTVVAFPSAVNIFYLGTTDPLSIILLYIGITFLVSAFPLVEDALKMWSDIFDGDMKKSKKILLAVPAAILRTGAYVESTGLSIVTATLYIAALPYLVALVIG